MYNIVKGKVDTHCVQLVLKYIQSINQPTSLSLYLLLHHLIGHYIGR